MQNNNSSLLSILSMYSVDIDSSMLLSKSNFLGAISLLSSDKMEILLSLVQFIPPPIDQNDFGSWVSKVRNRLDLTQTEVGNLLAVKKDRISKLESNKQSLNKEDKEKLRNLLVGLLKDKNYL